nr:hypothetical protein [Candidatus Sigynarchaeota archaeon]
MNVKRSMAIGYMAGFFLFLFSVLLLTSFVSAAVAGDETISTSQGGTDQPPFNGMYFNYTFSSNMTNDPTPSTGADVFSSPPAGGGGLFLINSSITNRFVNSTSRVISQSHDMHVRNGTHDWIWIPRTSQPGINIPVAIRNSTDQQFQIVGNTTFSYENKTYRCWKLSSVEGSIAYYEQSTGLLVNATFMYQWGGERCQNQIILVATNVAMTPIDGFLDDEIIIGGIIGVVILAAGIGISQGRKRMNLSRDSTPKADKIKPARANLNAKVKKPLQLPQSTSGTAFPKTEFPKMPADQAFPKMPADHAFPKMPADQGAFPKMPADRTGFLKNPADQTGFLKMPADQAFPKTPADQTGFLKMQTSSAGTNAVKPMQASNGTATGGAPTAMKTAPTAGAKEAMPTMKPAKSVSPKDLDEEHM